MDINDLIYSIEKDMNLINKKRTMEVLLSNGYKINYNALDYYMYEFELEEDLELLDGTPIRLFADKESQGEILSISKKKLKISLDKDFGYFIHSANLIIEYNIFLEKVLSELKFAENNSVQTLINRSLGKDDVSNKKNQIRDSITNNLVNNQKDFFSHVASNKYTVIESSTFVEDSSIISYLVKRFFSKGKTVLFASNYNILVDSVILDLLKPWNKFTKGQILRLGPSIKEELIDYENIIDIKCLEENCYKKIKNQIYNNEYDLCKYITEISHLEEVIKAFEKNEELTTIIKVYESYVDEVKRVKDNLKFEKDSLLEEQRKLTEKLGKSPCRLLLIGNRRDKLISQRDVLQSKIREIKNNIDSKEKELEITQKQLHDLYIQYTKMKLYKESYQSVNECNKRKYNVELQAKLTRENLKTLNNELISIRENLISNSRVLATTVIHGTLQKEMIKNSDTVIIYEGVNSPLYLSYLVANLATSNIVIFRSSLKQGESKELVIKDSELTAIDELFYKTEIYRNSQEYMELIRFISKFKKYSPYNCMLMHIQNPNLTYVASIRDWERNFERYPKEDARPLVILQPFGPVMFLYDVMDTVGRNIPEEILRPFKTEGEFPKFFLENVISNCDLNGIKVIMESLALNKAGYAQRVNKNNKEDYDIKEPPLVYNYKIVININLPQNDQFSTLIHELAHIFCGHLGMDPINWWVDRSDCNIITEEIEAETVTYIICNRLGLISTSEKYLVNYKNEKNKVLPELSFNSIFQTADRIEEWGQKICKRKTKKNRPFKNLY
ncbi:hypothetical protein [Bacillus sp. FJAT-29814]|uniref:hypothetical protein n=1 Tax=Bacillus sp. FJAT-29814 TaxID=1729688 RepID=UPI0008346A42|nr:hypothetical protein [Bacillus sp. FJAT-29814]